MTKKIKFALKMGGGTGVRTLDDFRDHFDLPTALEHFFSGKLEQWLELRHYDALAEELFPLHEKDVNSPDTIRTFCEVLGVKADEKVLFEGLLAKRRSEKKDILRMKTADPSVLEEVDSYAFNREDLKEILRKGISTIYLCGDSFFIPKEERDRTFIGVFGKPEIRTDAEDFIGLIRNHLYFKNVTFDEHIHGRRYKEYEPSEIRDFADKSIPDETYEKIYETASMILLRVPFDPEVRRRPILEAVKAARINGHFDPHVRTAPMLKLVREMLGRA